MKKIFSALLVVVFALSCATATAFAAEPSVEAEESYQIQTADTESESEITPRSFGGYGHRVTGTGSGSFEVSCPSGAGLGAGITLRSDCGSDGAFSIISIEKPDGSFFNNSVYIDGNTEEHYQIWFPQNGTYIVHYNTYTPGKTVHLQCWVYG